MRRGCRNTAKIPPLRPANYQTAGQSGYHSFVKSEGDLHTVIWKSLEAKIKLLNPYSEAARIRASALLDSAVTPEALGEQVEKPSSCASDSRQARSLYASNCIRPHHMSNWPSWGSPSSCSIITLVWTFT
jgi:hypothetical protein